MLAIGADRVRAGHGPAARSGGGTPTPGSAQTRSAMIMEPDLHQAEG